MGEVENQVTTEVCRGKEALVLWKIKNWNTKDKKDFELLNTNSSCVLKVGPVSAKEEVEQDLGAFLRFYFETYIDVVKEKDGYSSTEEHGWLSLCAEELSNRNNRIIQYEIQADLVDDKMQVIDYDRSVNVRHGRAAKITLRKEFIKLYEKILRAGKHSYLNDVPPTACSRPAEINIKLSVTPIYILSRSDFESDGDAALDERESYLCKALKKMFVSEDIYPDIILETKDYIPLDAHKFMLAARSPVIYDMIEKSGKENNFNNINIAGVGDGVNGTIKLSVDVNAKPMKVILHWMYTGELLEIADKWLEEVLDAATKFELTGLIKIMDKKMITICNKDNMIQLYQFAKANRMRLATANIIKFMKENLD